MLCEPLRYKWLRLLHQIRVRQVHSILNQSQRISECQPQICEEALGLVLDVTRGEMECSPLLSPCPSWWFPLLAPSPAHQSVTWRINMWPHVELWTKRNNDSCLHKPIIRCVVDEHVVIVRPFASLQTPNWYQRHRPPVEEGVGSFQVLHRWRSEANTFVGGDQQLVLNVGS